MRAEHPFRPRQLPGAVRRARPLASGPGLGVTFATAAREAKADGPAHPALRAAPRALARNPSLCPADGPRRAQRAQAFVRAGARGPARRLPARHDRRAFRLGRRHVRPRRLPRGGLRRLLRMVVPPSRRRRGLSRHARRPAAPRRARGADARARPQRPDRHGSRGRRRRDLSDRLPGGAVPAALPPGAHRAARRHRHRPLPPPTRPRGTRHAGRARRRGRAAWSPTPPAAWSRIAASRSSWRRCPAILAADPRAVAVVAGENRVAYGGEALQAGRLEGEGARRERHRPGARAFRRAPRSAPPICACCSARTPMSI